jgi:hypothetical protein
VQCNPDSAKSLPYWWAFFVCFYGYLGIKSVFGPKNEESKKHPILKYAYQFAEAD